MHPYHGIRAMRKSSSSCRLHSSRLCQPATCLSLALCLQLPRHMLILFVGIVFSVINPLVPVMTIIYFAVALLTERYNLLYVYTPIFESGGKVGDAPGVQPATSRTLRTPKVLCHICLFSWDACKLPSGAWQPAPHGLDLASFWSCGAARCCLASLWLWTVGCANALALTKWQLRLFRMKIAP